MTRTVALGLLLAVATVACEEVGPAAANTADHKATASEPVVAPAGHQQTFGDMLLPAAAGFMVGQSLARPRSEGREDAAPSTARPAATPLAPAGLTGPARMAPPADAPSTKPAETPEPAAKRPYVPPRSSYQTSPVSRTRSPGLSGRPSGGGSRGGGSGRSSGGRGR